MEIIKLQQLQSNFASSIENSLNKKFDIDTEINEVTEYINKIPAYSTFRNPPKTSFENKANKVFDIKIPNLLRSLFSDAFKSYIKHGMYQLEKLHTDTNETYQIKEDIVKQAYGLVDYYKWLNSLLNEPQKVIKKSSLSHKQKLLALHYLGLNTTKYDNTKIAKILSEILDLSEDNTRQFLSYLTAGKNEVRTKNNLEKVNQLFNNQGFDEISNTIKSEIEKL